MRNLNECQAEVFRRSDKRIKARKKCRNHVLMTCVPLALCVSVLTVFMLTGVKVKVPETDEAAGMPPQNESAQCSALKIEVSGQGKTKEYTDPAVVKTVCDQISGYYALYAESTLTTQTTSGGGADDAETEVTPGLTGSLTGSNGYQIVITLENGSKLLYDLNGRVLMARNTNRSYTLTKDQQKQLTALLGIAP